MMCSTNVNLGSADVVQLNHDDADWSDLIVISDVTRTVYISFDAQERPQLANVFNLCNVFLCSHYPTIMAEKFEGGQITRYC